MLHSSLPVDAAGLEHITSQIPTDQPLWSQPSTAPLLEHMAYYAIPGVSIAVIVGGELAWSQGFGVLAAGSTAPVTPATRFQACSISKQVAMIGALRLVAAGVLELDRPIQPDLGGWTLPVNRDWQPQITLRHLLGHTAGLTNNWYRGFRRDAPQPSVDQVLRGEAPANTPPVRAVLLPGSQFRYSGSHYTVLQHLLTTMTGQPFPTLMHDLVFAPLGMTHSSYDQSYPETQPDMVATGHYIGGAPLPGKWRVYPEMAAAGLWTTPTDLALLAMMIQQVAQGRSSFLPQTLIEQALTSPTGDPYGLGLELKGSGATRRFSHSGSNVGYVCLSMAYVEQGLGAVVMTNSDDGYDVLGPIFAAIADAYAWPDYGLKRPEASAVPQAAEWVGAYDLRPDYTLTITQRAAQLVLTVPGQAALELYPTGPQSYATAALNSVVRFQTDDLGQVSLVLTQEGQEQIARRTSR